MPYEIEAFETTPNPNAIKCVIAGTASDTPRSYFNRGQAEAARDELALALFGIEGVTSLLIHHRFITLNKADASGWGPIKRAARRVLAEAP